MEDNGNKPEDGWMFDTVTYKGSGFFVRFGRTHQKVTDYFCGLVTEERTDAPLLSDEVLRSKCFAGLDAIGFQGPKVRLVRRRDRSPGENLNSALVTYEVLFKYGPRELPGRDPAIIQINEQSGDIALLSCWAPTGVCEEDEAKISVDSAVNSVALTAWREREKNPLNIKVAGLVIAQDQYTDKGVPVRPERAKKDAGLLVYMVMLTSETGTEVTDHYYGEVDAVTGEIMRYGWLPTGGGSPAKSPVKVDRKSLPKSFAVQIGEKEYQVADGKAVNEGPKKIQSAGKVDKSIYQVILDAKDLYLKTGEGWFKYAIVKG
jgi:hypothetical protein